MATPPAPRRSVRRSIRFLEVIIRRCPSDFLAFFSGLLGSLWRDGAIQERVRLREGEHELLDVPLLRLEHALQRRTVAGVLAALHAAVGERQPVPDVAILRV